MSARAESVTVEAGTFDMPIWLPESGSGPGMLLIQEIWGVGPYIVEVAEELAALGYVVAAPDLFWRVEPNYVGTHDEEGLKQAIEVSSRFEVETGVADLAAAVDHLAGLPEVSAGVGALGFCLGGTMAYLLAARTTLGAVVSFYGSGVPDSLNLLPDIDCPVQFHFGGSDPYIPREQVALVEQAVSGLPNVEIHVQEDGGHAFHNRLAPMFHQPEPAARAWALTEAFLAKNLPV
ncbi:dienelactone hydrolase family protein [Actinomadura alba]|uniref:Dienelactone hydrolase family protein n=1 Tax=Actinomadura alba TaxID=406431 RepID=A0ABR7LPV2_9ACTN|nr:dienelactone hydrolase family protein [Actinomadura alba]MBC6466512.1 dienelactone hydrolase family protein [Actinomadura alba]